MADKQIGIKLNVQSTGLKTVDESLDTISKNLQGMNKDVLKHQQKGWGTESQTKELREQLRTMQQLLQTTERMARMQGVSTPSFGSMNQEIGTMQRDLSNTPAYKSRVAGMIHQKYGRSAAEGYQKLSGYAGKAAALYGGFDLFNTIRSGFSTGDQLAFGLGDLSKRMAPGMNSLAYGQNMLNGLQGYGYTDPSIMQSAVAYGAATGRMNPNAFNAQMQAIEGTGRRYGWDLSSTTQTFANAWQSGVTGGSQAQMSPQEYANLVANAVNRGNMQGKEAQLVGQMQQLTQMSIASMGTAGNQKTIGGLVAMGDRTGNQALLNQLPQILGAINGGIQSPGGGYAGQAMMMQAIGGGKMGYWQEQYQQSQGAFAKNPINGKSNFENVLNYAMKSFGGKGYQTYDMMSQLIPGLTPSMAKMAIDTYTKNGSFNAADLANIQKSLGQNPGSIPQNASDAARNNQLSKSHAANMVGYNTVPSRSWLDSVTGGAINEVGTPLVYVGGAAMALKGGATVVRGAKTAVRVGSRLFGKDALAPTTKSGGSWLSRLFGAGAKTAATEGAGAAEVAGATGLEEAAIPMDWNPVGWGMSAAGLALGLYGMYQMGNAGVKSVSPSRSSTRAQNTKTGFVHIDSSASASRPSGSVASSTTGSELAPIVASTIVALAPYMNQLRPYLGTASGGSSQGDLVYRGNTATTGNLVSYPGKGSGWSGLTNLSNLVGGGSTGSIKATAFSGSASDFAKKMAPYANQVSMKTGLPADFVLGQWGIESGWGTSQAAQQNNNFAGIEPWSGASAGADSTYAGYGSLSSFASGYSDFLTKNPNYKKLLGAAKGGASDSVLAGIMGHSGYATDPNYANAIRNGIGAVRGAVKLQGSIVVSVKQQDGTVAKVNTPVTATFPAGLAM